TDYESQERQKHSDENHGSFASILRVFQRFTFHNNCHGDAQECEPQQIENDSASNKPNGQARKCQQKYRDAEGLRGVSSHSRGHLSRSQNVEPSCVPSDTPWPGAAECP